MSRRCSASASTGIVVTGRRADQRPRLECLPGRPDALRLFAVRRAERVRPRPRRRRRGGLAVEHLLSLGRKRIAHITGPERFDAVRLRRDGLSQGAEAAGIATPTTIICRRWSEDWGREAIAKLFAARRSSPMLSSAVTTSSRAARATRCANGHRVPQASRSSASTIGRCRRAARPPLTSIDMNLKELGREAGELPDGADRRQAAAAASAGCPAASSCANPVAKVRKT